LCVSVLFEKPDPEDEGVTCEMLQNTHPTTCHYILQIYNLQRKTLSWNILKEDCSLSTF